jgi:hypothetical protein
VSSTFLGLTSCPYLLPSALSRLPLLVPTSRQLRLVLSTIPSGHEHYQSLEHLRSFDYHSTSNSVSTIPPRIAYSTFYHLCVDYSFLSTTSPHVDYFLTSATPYINILQKYSALFKISTMSTGYGPRILGRCRPTHSYAIRDSGPQETGGGNCGHASTKSGLLMARIGSSIVSCTLRTFDPANG